MKDLSLRSLSGIVYVALIALITLYSPSLFLIGFSILFLLCFWELSQLLQFQNKWNLLITFAVSVYLLYSYGIRFYTGQSSYPFSLVNILPVFLFGIATFTLFKRPDEIAFDSSKIIFSIVYLSLPFALALTLNRAMDFAQMHQATTLFFIFLLIWCSDSFAYLTGSLFGKTQFTSISQNKTVEGLIGGFVSVIIIGFFLEKFFPEMRGNWIVLSIIIGLFAPLGDLAESKLKRLFGVKDSSNLIPGHGGFLDRLDSFLVVSVAVYTYFLFIA